MSDLFHVTIERDALISRLDALARVVDKRTSIPILACVRFTATADKLTACATDMDAWLNVTIPTATDYGQKPGDVATALHPLLKAIKATPKGCNVELQDDGDGALAVRAGRTRFNLKTQDVADFPALAVDFAPWFTVDAYAMATGLGRTMFAISTEETRYYLNGVYMHERDGRMVVVATDGHRLAKADLPEACASAKQAGIVPRAVAALVDKLLPKEGPVSACITAEQTHARFCFGDYCLAFKLIDGTFPDYQRVIPDTADAKPATFDKAAMVDAIKRVTAISSRASCGVKFAFKRNAVTVSIDDLENGQACEEVDADYQGDALEIGFNRAYCLDMLANLDDGDDRATMDLTAASNPTIWRAPRALGHVCVLMPMRI